MKNFQLAIFAIVATSFFVTSCSKDNTPPTILITSPVDGSTLEKGKTYQVACTVTDDTGIKEIDLGNNQKITTFDSPTSHIIKGLSFVAPDTSNVTLTLKVSATDVDGLLATKSVSYQIK